MEHEKTWYDYKSALSLRYPAAEPIAEKYHGQHTSLNMKFDSVEDASGFMKAVYQGKEGKRIYKAEMSFINPRNPHHLSRDHSEACCILM